MLKLTAKNIQCMRAILSMAQYYGGMLGTAWHYVFATIQVFISLLTVANSDWLKLCKVEHEVDIQKPRKRLHERTLNIQQLINFFNFYLE